MHGWQGSGPDHWQTWLAEQLLASGREVRYPALPNKDNPTLDVWLPALHAAIEGLPDDGYDVVCHSVASVLWLHHTVNPGSTPRPARVALVSPPSPEADIPELATFLPAPLNTDAVRSAADGTVLVASDNDPYCPEGAAAAYGRPLRMATTVVPGGGHINPDAGFGPWPAVLDWCGRDNLAFIG